LYAEVQVQGKGKRKRVITRGEKNTKMKRKQMKRRLPKDMFLKLRNGGPHATSKGKKGYNRKKEKDLLRKELDVISFSQVCDSVVANYGYLNIQNISEEPETHVNKGYKRNAIN